MNINSAAMISFSSTGNTKKITSAIAKGLDVTSTKLIDLTSPAVRNTATPYIEEDMVIIGVPVYRHRIPMVVYPYLSHLDGNGKPVVLVTVCGNVDEGVALHELHSIAGKAGFNIVAAGSFIGEHSFSTDEVPIAKGRPDKADLSKAEAFGKSIKEKLRKMDNGHSASLDIPQTKLSLMGRILPENATRMLTKTPVADATKCNRCGVCTKLCPMSAIDGDTFEIEESQCLRCFRCVRSCSREARRIEFKKRQLVARFFTRKNKVKREPSMYF